MLQLVDSAEEWQLLWELGACGHLGPPDGPADPVRISTIIQHHVHNL